MTLDHKPECSERIGKQLDARKEWEERYPNYCKECNAEGIIMCGGDSVPYGSTNVHLPEYPEPCESCWGKCPRCGEWFFEAPPPDYGNHVEIDLWNDLVCDFEDQEKPCPHCNWNRGKNSDDLMPLVQDWCNCFEEDYWDA